MQADPTIPIPEAGLLAGRLRRRFGKWLLLIAGLAGLLALGVFLFSSDQQSLGQRSPQTSGPSPAPKASGAIPEVQVTKPVRGDVSATLRLPANIAPFQQATLFAKVSGYLRAVAVDKGDHVKVGQVLAVIDDPELEERYQQAQSEFAIKKVTYERLFNVWKENPDVIAKQDVDLAEAAYLGAKHALEQLAAMLDYTKVRSPFDGIVTARFVDPGALIQAATSSATQAVPLFTVMDISTLRIYVNVPQEDAVFVKKGTPATITLKDVEKKVEATVTRSTIALDPGTRTMLAEIDVPNPGYALAPGMFAEVILTLRQHRNALVIPPAALVSENSSKAVFVVAQGVAQKVHVKTDIDDGVWVEVTEGLTGSEEVVVVGKASLVDGMTVKASPYNLPAGKPSSQKY
jgi:RND family efflux transporter MFP subunit